MCILNALLLECIILKLAVRKHSWELCYAVLQFFGTILLVFECATHFHNVRVICGISAAGQLNNSCAVVTYAGTQFLKLGFEPCFGAENAATVRGSRFKQCSAVQLMRPTIHVEVWLDGATSVGAAGEDKM